MSRASLVAHDPLPPLLLAAFAGLCVTVAGAAVLVWLGFI